MVLGLFLSCLGFNVDVVDAVVAVGAVAVVVVAVVVSAACFLDCIPSTRAHTQARAQPTI